MGRFRTAIAERSSCFDIAIFKAAAAIEYPNGIATSAPSSRRWSAARTAETASASESVRTRLQQRPVAVAGAPLTHCARSCAGSFSPGFEIRAAIEHPAGVQRFVAIIVAWSRGWPHCSLAAARELGTAIITAAPGCQRCCGPRDASLMDSGRGSRGPPAACHCLHYAALIASSCCAVARSPGSGSWP